jgi:hypothetical protein
MHQKGFVLCQNDIFFSENTAIQLGVTWLVKKPLIRALAHHTPKTKFDKDSLVHPKEQLGYLDRRLVVDLEAKDF